MYNHTGSTSHLDTLNFLPNCLNQFTWKIDRGMFA